MNVWLVHIGETLPTDEGWRPFRYSLLADALTAAGHNVVRWAPTFQHGKKEYRAHRDTSLDVSQRYAIQLLHAPGYKRNVSLKRIRFHRALARSFREAAAKRKQPDAIVAAVPSTEWACEAVRYGRAFGIKTILDVRDLWPDLFVNALPPFARSVGFALCRPFVQQVKFSAQYATGLVGVSEAYLEWGLKHAGRPRGPSDRVFPLGYRPPTVSAADVEDRIKWFRHLGVDPAQLVCVFIGQFEATYDVETIIAAAEDLYRAGRPVQFLLCGDGHKMFALRKAAKNLPNVFLPGSVDQTGIAAALRVAKVGLVAYAKDAPQSLPNKPFEYFSGGLAILSSLRSELDDLLSAHDCGMTYQPGDSRRLAQLISELECDEEKRLRLAAHGNHLYEKLYRADVIYPEFVRYIESLG